MVRGPNMKNRWAKFGGGILLALSALAAVPAVSAPYDEKKSGYDSFVIESPASQADDEGSPRSGRRRYHPWHAGV